MRDSREAVLSSPESLIEDALRLYKQARDIDPENKKVSKKIEEAEKNMEERRILNSPKKVKP